jgi:hypothetical protein
VDYFLETKVETEDGSGRVYVEPIQALQPEKDLFVKLEKDDVKVSIEEQARIIHDIRDSRLARVPWLHNFVEFP